LYFQLFELCGEKAILVGFRIEKQWCGYAKADILDKFYEGIIIFQYTGLMQVVGKTPNVVKKNVVKNSVHHWRLLVKIKRVLLDTDGLLERCGDEMSVENDLQRRVHCPGQHFSTAFQNIYKDKKQRVNRRFINQ
jgi:hypothetical protein